MYKLKIGAYKDFEPDFSYMKGDYIPRKAEIIKKYAVIYEDENKNEIKEYWTLEVQTVHYELFEDNSTLPIVYANVISSCLKEEYENE